MVKKYSVLIVDDEPGIRESLADFLEDQGWQAYRAGSAEEALRIVSGHSLDAALVDIRLPGTQGDAFIIKANQINSSLCYIVTTGSPDYLLPIGKDKLPRTSNKVLRKPIWDLFDVERALIEHIRTSKG